MFRYDFCHNVFTGDDRATSAAAHRDGAHGQVEAELPELGPLRLYNLEEDPGEHHNVIDDPANFRPPRAHRRR
ncbi:MAG: hypothetical protein R2748_23340 [Bryobacterales bacterium]